MTAQTSTTPGLDRETTLAPPAPQRPAAPEAPSQPASWAVLDDADKKRLLDDSLAEYMNAGPTGLYLDRETTLTPPAPQRPAAPEAPSQPASWAVLDDADKKRLLDDSLAEYMNAGPTGLY